MMKLIARTIGTIVKKSVWLPSRASSSVAAAPPTWAFAPSMAWTSVRMSSTRSSPFALSGSNSPVTMIFVTEVPSTFVSSIAEARTTPSISLTESTTSSAWSVSATIQIGWDSPGGKWSARTSSPCADSDWTRNFSVWSRPIDDPMKPVAMTPRMTIPAPRWSPGLRTTRVAMVRQMEGLAASVVVVFSEPGSVTVSSAFGMKGQNIFFPQIASTGGRAKRTAAAEMSRPTAAVMPRPRVPGMIAKTRLSRDRTTVRFEARIVVAVCVQASASAARWSAKRRSSSR